MIKVLENNDTKNQILKIEAATKINYCFTICENQKKEPTILRCLSLFLKRFDCTLVLRNRHAFARSKMASFHIKNRKYDIKNVAICAEILQVHRYTIAVITCLYLNARIRISKALRK